ncbi:hypothetical protein OHB12_17485 [Nocardia sp. NBC_01730]|uniref:hypothetical protein n=1 Tax=Nocardia sp. NBC_01730 TaxID=2975998 RepID=UPI002E113035|nr:hypothetical protein OHB12_17485 [Nocardia sp. NBC_01730]
MSKLVEVLLNNEIADISREALRQILKAGGESVASDENMEDQQRPRMPKMNRVLDLYDNPRSTIRRPDHLPNVA